MGSRANTILWAQWRTLRNYFPRSNKFGLALTTLIGVIWYGGFLLLSISAAFLLASPDALELAAKILPPGLFFAFFYWQVMPLLLVSSGSALEIRKLVVYPIPKRELFGLEVLLRFSTGIEVVLVLIGTGVGLLLNPRVPWWAPFSLVVFTAFNLFFAAGIRDLLVRLFARKVIREILILAFALAAGLPQLLVLTHPIKHVPVFAGPLGALPWPWIATAALVQGHFSWLNALALAGWTLAAYLFGRWQFERGLRFDAQESAATPEPARSSTSRLEAFFRLPGWLCADPLGVLIEKELRFLTRSARFRLVFLMGFSFGLLIWLPVTFGRAASPNSWTARNYLALLSVYALLLLSDTLFWNVFGFDRSAAQVYFMVPVKMRTVLYAKNLAALLFVMLEVLIISTVCLILRFPVTVGKLAEAVTVVVTISIFMMAMGNLSSTYNPRAADPAKSFRNSAGRQTQAALMFFFPLALLPGLLAYAARFAFRSNLAFYGVLLFGILFGFLFYRIATESAVATADRTKEAMIGALSGSAGPVSG